MSKNVIVMTVKGHTALTYQCLETLKSTIGVDSIPIIIIDAAEAHDKVDLSAIPSDLEVHYENWSNCGISRGWNIGIELAETIVGDIGNVWLLNNDVTFDKVGWWQKLNDKLNEPNVGIVGTYAMYSEDVKAGFITGGIWGFKLSIAKSVAEDGKILDEHTNFAGQDVDLSVRIARAGYTVTCTEGVELFGVDPAIGPMLTHRISATTGLEDSSMSKRSEEMAYLRQKYGVEK
jgi:GT2 family glycosyltransferase